MVLLSVASRSSEGLPPDDYAPARARGTGGRGEAPLGEDAHRAELRAAGAAEIAGLDAFELREVRDDRLAQEQRGTVDVGLGATLRLGHDPLDHAEVEAVRGVEAE